MRWQCASVGADAFASVPGDDDVPWRDVDLPARGSDEEDHWFRTVVTASERQTVVRLGGLATICDVYVDREHVLRSESMFVARELTVESGTHELAVCARALAPRLAEPRKPRARWRTRVADGNLRWFRTSLLGRAPGFAAGAPLVGPFRPVEVVDPRVPRPELRTRLEGADGVVEVRSHVEAGALEVSLADVVTTLPPGGGSVRVASPERWWPHSHGTPALHRLRVRGEHGESTHRVGFRTLETVEDPARDGLDLRVNGVAVFVRGAVWTPTSAADALPTLERARDGGFNLLRVVGTMLYESDAFHDACDELGLLVWQDLMFANMDYPFADDTFRELVDQELAQLVQEVGGRPSLAVVCGNSEVEQQVAMLGLPPDLGRAEFYTVDVPRALRESAVDAVYVQSAPTGGALPFRTDAGVANYFGVGAYLRPPSDARAAHVRFASECLAFANVPKDDPPDRTAGVMRDVGADWDFADVRDHYLRTRHDRGPGDERYWDWSRLVTGELAAGVFGEWRRRASPCRGGIVLWLRDLVPGAGWGILDADGRPKPIWHHLRRALAPVAVWLVDEGLNGVSVHTANDTGEIVDATLRLALYRDESFLVAAVEETVELPSHATLEHDAEELLGRFVDISYAYRFGAVQQDAVVATLERSDVVLSQAFFYPVGRRSAPASGSELGLCASAHSHRGGIRLMLRADRVLHAVCVRGEGVECEDDFFDLEPGRDRNLTLHGNANPTRLHISALNLDRPLAVEVT